MEHAVEGAEALPGLLDHRRHGFVVADVGGGDEDLGSSLPEGGEPRGLPGGAADQYQSGSGGTG